MADVTSAGILTTASDLLFTGGREGYFWALDARTGQELWRANVGGDVASGAMTYAVNGTAICIGFGRQFVVYIRLTPESIARWNPSPLRGIPRINAISEVNDPDNPAVFTDRVRECAAESDSTDRLTLRERFTLTGHIHPQATAANDQGRVAASLQLSYVTLTFTRSPSQDADLQKLLAEQQNPQSASYHRWLTPEEYADRFGVSASDLDKITSWLRSQGLMIANVARGRSWVAVNGSAAQVEAAFQTEIHQYLVNGKRHFANATEPSVPAAIGPLVLGIRGLHNFRMRPLNAKPRYTPFRSVRAANCLAPADFATIYNVAPLYAKGIDGTGQKIAVVGQTGIDPSDIATFRSNYGLPANPPQIMLIPGSADPGIRQDELARGGSGHRMVRGRWRRMRHSLRVRERCDGRGSVCHRPEPGARSEFQLWALRGGERARRCVGFSGLGAAGQCGGYHLGERLG